MYTYVNIYTHIPKKDTNKNELFKGWRDHISFYGEHVRAGQRTKKTNFNKTIHLKL